MIPPDFDAPHGLVYKTQGDDQVVMPRLQAVLHARAWVAGESARAWGELRDAIRPAGRGR